VVGCAAFQNIPLNLLSTEQEIALGEQVSAEVEKGEKLLDNVQIQAYVSEIGQRLAAVSPRRDVQYTFKVIDAPDKVNAFALPGGFMYVYTGLMRTLENEAELAGVMAHEIGHVAGRHHGESMTRQFGYNFIMSIILGEDANALAQLGSELLGAAGAMYYSRDNEREADQLGMSFLFEAGYKPEAMLTLMGKLSAEDGERGGGRSLAIFASHPPTEERAQRLRALVEQYPKEVRDGRPLYTERYRQKILDLLQ
jgi:predicted Zn-dependent protease